MGMRARNKKLYAAIETTYNTAATVAAADAIKTSGIGINRYGGDRVSQEYDRAGLGNDRQINVNPWAGLTEFMVPFIGSGDTATAPAWGRLLRACGAAETDDTTDNSEWYYTPVDSGFESLTCVLAEESIEQKMVGVRGNFGITANPGELPVFTFSNWQGSYNQPTALALTDPDDSAFLDAVPVTKTNTGTLTLGGTQYPIGGFTFDAGVQLTRINQPGRQETVVENRTPSGSIIVGPDASADLISLMGNLESHNGLTDVTLALIHGSGAGSIVKVDIPALNLGEPSDQAIAGETYLSLPFTVIPPATGDEWKITQAAS